MSYVFKTKQINFNFKNSKKRYMFCYLKCMLNIHVIKIMSNKNIIKENNVLNKLFQTNGVK